jgi:hypothetical protein
MALIAHCSNKLADDLPDVVGGVQVGWDRS